MSTNNIDNKKTKKYEAYIKNIPYIQCGKDKFYADRFYLNATFHNTNSNDNNAYAFPCNSTNPNAPPLFNRWRIMAELDLVGVICATYVFDSIFLSRCLPKLFPTRNGQDDQRRSYESCIPTLLMYNSNRYKSSIHRGKNKDLEVADEGDTDDESEYQDKENACDNNKVFHDSVNVTGIKVNRGVFHPKLSLLFERNGDLVVIISTANCTRPTSVDGSWCQRFRRKRNIEASNYNMKWTDRMRYDRSDFGWVLADFLFACGKAKEHKHSLSPQQFLQKHLQFKSLDHFVQSFHFEESQVHLIATVPGAYATRNKTIHGRGAKSDAYVQDRTYLYGPQRVEDIMIRQSQASRPWLEETYLSKTDTIILQPTSIGSNWNNKALGGLVQMYLGTSKVRISRGSFTDAVKQSKILWPSRNFMESCKEIANSADEKWWGLPYQKVNESDELILGHFAFLSSVSFNTFDESFLSCFNLYKASKPPQIDHFSPHFKSYARVSYHGLDRRPENITPTTKRGIVDFSWFMLTSACLSFGAQGMISSKRDIEGELVEEVRYNNFEIGVLFCSRLQSFDTDRVYTFDPTGAQRGKNAVRIHLPIPYTFNTETYEIDPAESPEYRCDPFFSLIRHKDRYSGNMRYTPLGSINER